MKPTFLLRNCLYLIIEINQSKQYWTSAFYCPYTLQTQCVHVWIHILIPHPCFTSWIHSIPYRHWLMTFTSINTSKLKILVSSSVPYFPSLPHSQYQIKYQNLSIIANKYIWLSVTHSHHCLCFHPRIQTLRPKLFFSHCFKIYFNSLQDS